MPRSIFAFLFIAVFLLHPARIDAQQANPGPYLVRDINTHTSIYNKPLELMEAGPVSYFFGSGGHGLFGLWKTDGTPGGTSFVKELGLGSQDNSASADLSAVLGNFLFFGASEPANTIARNGVELWRTDGTAQGTTLVADLVAGEGSSRPRKFIQMNGKVFFVAGLAIWRLDGPDTLPVHIWGNILDENHNETLYPLTLSVLGDQLFFSCYQGELGRELWVSDGTPEGTHPLVDLNPGTASSNPLLLLSYDGRLYFSADDGSTGAELWFYEAATDSIHRVADINPSGGSSPGTPQPMNGVIFFAAYEPEYGRELYRLDGDIVRRAIDINTGLTSSSPYLIGPITTTAGERLLFSARGADQALGLFTTDGTGAGTVRILNQISGDLYRGHAFYQGTLYFQNNSVENGLEVWRTDGTAAGTALLKDIWPGPNDSYPYNFRMCGNRLCFVADDGDHGSELWSTEGSTEGTALVADLNDDAPGSHPSELTTAGSLVYFLADDGNNGESLWRTDGTNAGTMLLLSGGIFASGPVETLISSGSRVYFTMYDGAHGEELWFSDGTPENTRILIDINPGPNSSYPGLITAQGNNLFFTAIDPVHGRELWKTDGTPAGTQIVADLNRGVASTDIRGIYPYKGKVVFTVFLGTSSGYELWLTDGTTQGTIWIAAIPEPNGYQPFVEANGLLFFITGVHKDNILWQTDGTGPGTIPVPAPACAGAYGVIYGMNVMDESLFFINSDWYSSTYPEIPLTLARTRGAQSGVECVWNTSFYFGSGGVSYEIKPMVVHGRHVIFNVPEPGFQQHLMISDGTSAGTRAFPGEVKSLYALQSAGPFLFFRGNSASDGEELWVLSNDTYSSSMVMDINTGPLSSSPADFVYRNGGLFFSADDGQHGSELWAYYFPAEKAFMPAVSH